MKKFEGILICSDLDGTLLRDDKSISKENIDAINYYKSEGGLFTFITGRMPLISEDIYKTVEPNAPFGCINGGGIYDHIKHEYAWMATLPREVLELARLADQEFPSIGIQVNTADNIYFNKDNPALVRFRAITGLPNNYCHYKDVKEPIAKIIFAEDEDAVIVALADAFNRHPLAERFAFIRSQFDLYEILPKGITKATALEKLTEHLGVDIKRTIAVGDYNNDIAMLKLAGVGIATGNACEAAKSAADRVTVSNGEHAIAKIIEELDRGIIQL